MRYAVGQKFGVNTVGVGRDKYVQPDSLTGQFGLPLSQVIGNDAG